MKNLHEEKSYLYQLSLVYIVCNSFIFISSFLSKYFLRIQAPALVELTFYWEGMHSMHKLKIYLYVCI